MNELNSAATDKNFKTQGSLPGKHKIHIKNPQIRLFYVIVFLSFLCCYALLELFFESFWATAKCLLVTIQLPRAASTNFVGEMSWAVQCTPVHVCNCMKRNSKRAIVIVYFLTFTEFKDNVSNREIVSVD